jgi:Holliday junction resolvasome RuvABC endonuclease subunit
MSTDRIVLGLDISSSITGVALINIDTDELLFYDHIDLRKTKCVFDKAEVVRKYLQAVQTSGSISNIYIEQPFSFFNSGGSTAKTMAILQKFNGIVSWICYDLWNIKPNYVGATEARKVCGIKVPRGQKAKQIVLEHVLQTEKTFSMEMTRNGNPKPETYDRADAIVVARAGSILEKQNERNTK